MHRNRDKATFHLSLRGTFIAMFVAGGLLAGLAPLVRQWDLQQNTWFWGALLLASLPTGLVLWVLCSLRRRAERLAGRLIHRPGTPGERVWPVWNALILVIMVLIDVFWLVLWVELPAGQWCRHFLLAAGMLAPTLVIPPIAFRMLIGPRAWMFEMRERGFVSHGYCFTPWQKISSYRLSETDVQGDVIAGHAFLTLRCDELELTVTLFTKDTHQVEEILRGATAAIA